MASIDEFISRQKAGVQFVMPAWMLQINQGEIHFGAYRKRCYGLKVHSLREDQLPAMHPRALYKSAVEIYLGLVQ